MRRPYIARAGAGGAMLLACTACCLPLAAPVLAFMGLIGIGAAGIGAVALAWMAVAWRRRRAQCPTTNSPNPA